MKDSALYIIGFICSLIIGCVGLILALDYKLFFGFIFFGFITLIIGLIFSIMFSFKLEIIKTILHFFHLEMHRYNGLTPMMKFVNSQQKQMGNIGVEIGTHFGNNAKQILNRMDIKMLYLIDPYISYKEYPEGKRWENLFGSFENAEEVMNKKLRKYWRYYTHIKKMSADAVDDIPDNLDFVYVDGNHSYKYVLEDIELYYPKLKDGGVIGGDDFNNWDMSEVTNAVLDFVNKYNLQLYSFGSDWWVVKGQGRQSNWGYTKSINPNWKLDEEIK
jgi:hypothetical protein